MRRDKIRWDVEKGENNELRRVRNEIRKTKWWEKTWNDSKIWIMRLEKKRWRGETWYKKKMRPERQAVTKRAKTRVKDIRKAWGWENKRWDETTKLRRVGKQEIRWNVKMKKWGMRHEKQDAKRKIPKKKMRWEK